MEIHKPKPWHGWREFLKEYLIIVVGVLTALAGEQGVEWLHWRHVLDDAREALAADQVRNLQWAGERDAQSRCVARELRNLGAALDRAEETGRLAPILSVTGPARRPWTLNSYDAIVSSQALSHLPARDSLLFAAHHGWSVYLSAHRDTEVHDWAVLRAMEGPGRKLGDAEIAALRGALSEAVEEQETIHAGSREFAHRIDQTRLLSPKAAADAWKKGEEDARRYWSCAPTHMGRNEYFLRVQEAPERPFPAYPPDAPNGPKP